ncbi:hypothetical protein VTL71DRAFT_7024 [Oculimacula yallundae]|uniref:Uncharacterized protein n=1 Tax=Oculimacula yallundae TaxID=86028 RepID=A0ABR4BVK0_9HELO
MTKTAATRSKEVSQSERKVRKGPRLSSVVGEGCGSLPSRIMADAVDSRYREVGDGTSNSMIVNPFQRMCIAVNGEVAVVDRGEELMIDSKG